MSHSKFLGVIRMDRSIMHRLTDEDIEFLRESSNDALAKYYGDLL